MTCRILAAGSWRLACKCPFSRVSEFFMIDIFRWSFARELWRSRVAFMTCRDRNWFYWGVNYTSEEMWWAKVPECLGSDELRHCLTTVFGARSRRVSLLSWHPFPNSHRRLLSLCGGSTKCQDTFKHFEISLWHIRGALLDVRWQQLLEFCLFMANCCDFLGARNIHWLLWFRKNICFDMACKYPPTYM